MRIALTGTEDHAIDLVERQLREAGHHIINCNERLGRGPTPDGCDPAWCPAQDGVDVVISVRAHPLSTITLREQRVLDCPLLRDVPLLVAGSPLPNPFGDRVVAMAHGYEHVDLAYLGADRVGS